MCYNHLGTFKNPQKEATTQANSGMISGWDSGLSTLESSPGDFNMEEAEYHGPMAGFLNEWSTDTLLQKHQRSTQTLSIRLWVGTLESAAQQF